MSDDLHDLAPLYALDALDGEERRDFERHLATCATCRAEVDAARDAAASLIEPVDPPASLRSSVLAEIGGVRQETAVSESPNGAVVALAGRRRPSAVVLLASAAAVIVLFVGAALLIDRGSVQPVDGVLAAPDVVVTTLGPTPDGGGGTFTVAWSAQDDRVAVVAEGLADPGPGRIYELWAIVDGRPQPAGLFDTEDGSVREAVGIADVDPSAWGVTIEPDGGSETPTTPILFFAESGPSA